MATSGSEFQLLRALQLRKLQASDWRRLWRNHDAPAYALRPQAAAAWRWPTSWHHGYGRLCNPDLDRAILELRYTFLLSAVAFVCTINGDRVSRGETAGLMEQLREASGASTTTADNTPAGAHLRVDIMYLGKLKHDAEVDGIRFAIPTSIVPLQGNHPECVLVVRRPRHRGRRLEAELSTVDGKYVKTIKSPSHRGLRSRLCATAAAAWAPPSACGQGRPPTIIVVIIS
ncbi:hypothetical protein MAPG_11312 [Magnaporthiopsis poae ATCC 64411]|uniref:Uncharacterized protein n=1 Tax=Magnaporthiopsis poae (strain ATCC 64411 / 73-15) TaxID=644358 RepID=A0A0C4EEY0_MAGP6|nr:hypothetical protein MAPG_11312 [Magnaporthiopsis poae ATCC 64411]